MKALVIGGTGFTGSYVVPRLLQAGYEVTCLVRQTSDRSHLPGKYVDFVEGSLEDVESLTRAMQRHDTLVCIASLGFGHAPGLVRAAEDAAIRRAIFISTTALFTQIPAKSKAVRLAAEAAIVHSTLPYTILRPTMIYGSDRDRNMMRLIRFLQRSPVIPVAGSGQRLMQPIYVDDVARAVVSALKTQVTLRRTYNIAGARPLTLDEIIDTICRILGRRVRKLHVPLGPIAAALHAFERLHLPFPIRAEQILRLNEDKAFAWDDAARDFGFDPISLEEGIAREIENPEHESRRLGTP
jgi:uncharacterized protein YbjT (DUF2867 family)